MGSVRIQMVTALKRVGPLKKRAKQPVLIHTPLPHCQIFNKH